MTKTFSATRRSIFRGLAYGATSMLGASRLGKAAETSAKPMQTLPPIIDVHAHCILPPWLEMARRHDPQGRAVFDGLASPSWSPEAALEVMNQSGIEVMVLSNSSGTTGEDPQFVAKLARQMNDAMAAIVAAHPRRFGAFAVLPLADIDASLAEIAYALDQLHLDGVCLQTNVNGAYFGDERFAPLFAELNRRKAVAFVHPVSPTFFSQIALPLGQGHLEYMFESTRAIASLVFSGTRRRFPDFTYLATHGGGTIPFLAPRLEAIEKQRAARTSSNAYGIDLSPQEVRAGIRSLHYDLTSSTSRGALAAIQDLVPSSQLLMGFDYPMRQSTFIEPSKKDMQESRVFNANELAAICRGNALRLLPALAARLKA